MEQKRQEIDTEGKLRMGVALCEGKITGEMYELTVGESFARSLKKLYQETARKNCGMILEREKRGFITPEERRFILGEGPEPKVKKRKGGSKGRNRKSAKGAAFQMMNAQTHREKLVRVLDGRAVMGQNEAVKRILESVKRYEEGNISEEKMKAELGSGYVSILKILYDHIVTQWKMIIMLVARKAHLSPEELVDIKKLLDERGEDDGGDETAGDGRDAEASGGADGGGTAGCPEGVH